MSFDSLDVYQQAKLPAEHYTRIKAALIQAYNQHREALKELLDIVQPIARQRIDAAEHGQSGTGIFFNVVKEILNGSQAEKFKLSANLGSDVNRLCVIMSDPDNRAIIKLEDYWSVAHTSNEKFNDVWPECTDENTSKLFNYSRSTGVWEFDDQEHTIELRVCSDFQGDQWGLDNAMTALFHHAINELSYENQWTAGTGAITFTVDEHAFINTKAVHGSPANPDDRLIPDEDWERISNDVRMETMAALEKRRRTREARMAERAPL